MNIDLNFNFVSPSYKILLKYTHMYKTPDKLEKVASLFRPDFLLPAKRKISRFAMCLSTSSFLSLRFSTTFRNLSARFSGEKRTPTNPILHRRLITWLEYSESRGNDSSRSRVINNLSNITTIPFSNSRNFLLLFFNARRFFDIGAKILQREFESYQAISQFSVFGLANFFRSLLFF